VPGALLPTNHPTQESVILRETEKAYLFGISHEIGYIAAESLELTLRFGIFQKLVTRLFSLLSEGDERECLVQTAPRQVTGLAVYQFPYLWEKSGRNYFKDTLREYIHH